MKSGLPFLHLLDFIMLWRSVLPLSQQHLPYVQTHHNLVKHLDNL
jgi:hypothetical protein